MMGTATGSNPHGGITVFDEGEAKQGNFRDSRFANSAERIELLRSHPVRVVLDVARRTRPAAATLQS